MQALEFLLVTRTHRLVMLLADRALHLRIHNARPHRHSRHIGLLDRQRGREVVQHGFAGAVRGPALVCACCGARGGDDDAAVGCAQGGQRGLHHADCAEDVDVVGLAPFGGGAVGDFLDRVERAVVDDEGVEAPEARGCGGDEGLRDGGVGGVSCDYLDAVFAVFVLEVGEGGGGAGGEDKLVLGGLREEVVGYCEANAWVVLAMM